MTEKNYFILHFDTFGVAADTLKDEELGELIRAIYNYNKRYDFEIKSPVVKAMFAMFKHLADLDDAKYQKVCEKRREAVQKRWANTSPSPSPPRENKPPKPKPMCHADYEWVEPEYHDAWEEWCSYKRASKKSYKTEHSLKIAYDQWKKKAGFDPETAKQIVLQSIANNYDGLFELKNNNNGNRPLTKFELNKLSAEQAANAIANSCIADFERERDKASRVPIMQL